MRRYPVPGGEARAEITVLNSRFIASAGPAFTLESARAFVARVRAEFVDASHHVPAFLVGYGATVVAHCHDDGEPSGTAGRPALAVLRGSGLGDLVVVVTRYFGGTKLGTGGLVRAYGDAVKAVLEVLPWAERVPTHTLAIQFPYPLFERVRLAVEAYSGRVLEQSFAGAVTLTVRLAVDRLGDLQQALRTLSNGSVQAVVLETDPDAVVPIATEGHGPAATRRRRSSAARP